MNPSWVVRALLDFRHGRCVPVWSDQKVWIGWDTSILSPRLVEGRPRHFLHIYQKGDTLFVESVNQAELVASVGKEPIVRGKSIRLSHGSTIRCEDWEVRIERMGREREFHTHLQATQLPPTQIAKVIVGWMVDVMEVCLKRERGLLPEQRMAYEARLQQARDRAEQAPERLSWECAPRMEELPLFIRTETYGKNHVSVPHSRATLDTLCELVERKQFSFSTLYQFLSCAAWSGVHCERLYGSLRREKQSRPSQQGASSFAEAFERIKTPTLWERTLGLFTDGSGSNSFVSPAPSKVRESRDNNHPISDQDWEQVAEENYSWQLDWLNSRMEGHVDPASMLQQDWEDSLYQEES